MLKNSEKNFIFQTRQGYSEPQYCGHCDNTVPMEIVACYSIIENYEDIKQFHGIQAVDWWEISENYELLICPTCKGIIFRSYHWHSAACETMSDTKVKVLYPIKPKEPEIPEEVKKISPEFITIYKQALFAEIMELDRICGVGYRKAIEFLIKDYCIYLNPDKEKEIKDNSLGNVIKKFINDFNIKACAERAAWLGNDETHYVREWQDKDINDLKELIQLTMQWIIADIKTKKYTKEMTKRTN